MNIEITKAENSLFVFMMVVVKDLLLDANRKNINSGNKTTCPPKMQTLMATKTVLL